MACHHGIVTGQCNDCLADELAGEAAYLENLMTEHSAGVFVSPSHGADWWTPEDAENGFVPNDAVYVRDRKELLALLHTWKQEKETAP